MSTFTSPEGQELRNEGVFGDVVLDERIVSLYTMFFDGMRIFSGILSVQFQPSHEGCLMKLAEQGVFYDGHDKPENHELGYGAMLEDLGRYLATQPRQAAQ